jgi:transposase
LTYRRTPSLYATGRAIGVTHQTVERCLRRARNFGVKAALKDSPRPGREPAISNEAKMFVLDLACRKAKDLGYRREVWTTRLLAEHVRERAPAVGYACLAHLAQGTLCKILAAQEIKPHKVRNYLERRDPEFDAKMAEVLAVYREVEQLKQAAEREDGSLRRSRSSPMTKSRASRRSRPPRPTWRRFPCAIRPSRAIMNTSEWERRACWPALIW